MLLIASADVNTMLAIMEGKMALKGVVENWLYKLVIVIN